MRPSEHTSPPVAAELLSPNAVSIVDGVAAVTISPFTRDLTEAERTAILAADRQRIFVQRCGDVPLARPGEFVEFSDYPSDTMKWCADHASLICLGALESGSTWGDVEALLSQFDTDEVAEHRFVIRAVVGAHVDIANAPWLQRPLESPPSIRSKKQARARKAVR